MLGLAKAGRSEFATIFASFSEGGNCQAFLREVHGAGFIGIELRHDTPRFLGATNEIQTLIKSHAIDVLVCHGYKAGLLGWWSARRAGIPVMAVSRGWTSENRKVRFYEAIDKRVLRWMDQVICVSQAQADKVRRCGVRAGRIVVIPNAIDSQRFAQVDPAGRSQLENFFPRSVKQIIGAAGRLSPEKGFDLLVAAAAEVIRRHPQAGFILFGDGPLQASLLDQVERLGLEQQFILAGFCRNLDTFMPHLDLFVQSSHTEGMPNVILEAAAAGVPIVATDVGGTSEVIEEARDVRLIPKNSVVDLIESISELTAAFSLNEKPKSVGLTAVGMKFSFDEQCRTYAQLFSRHAEKH